MLKNKETVLSHLNSPYRESTGVQNSEILSSEKSIFENYDCGDPCQRKNAAVMVKTMHQNRLHDILPVLYKVASILPTIPATSCSAERSFSALRRIKTFLRSTMGQASPLLKLKGSMSTRQCRMICKGLLTYSGVELIVFHTLVLLELKCLSLTSCFCI